VWDRGPSEFGPDRPEPNRFQITTLALQYSLLISSACLLETTISPLS
jgi:hypothetical protein